MTRSDPEITKWHFLGCVDYAQHNFARLKPLLYSETGRRWDGMADRAWFPHEGLVFTLEPFLSRGATWAVDGKDKSDAWTLFADKPAPTVQYEHTMVATKNGPVITTLLAA